MSRQSSPGDPAGDDRLAFLALTNTIDKWNHDRLHMAEQLLNDTDQQLLTRCHVKHLVPAARSIWWNNDISREERNKLLLDRYPLVHKSVWRQSTQKANAVLRAWRRDALRLFPELVDGEWQTKDLEDLEDDLAVLNALSRQKRRRDEGDSEIKRPNKFAAIVTPSSPDVKLSQERKAMVLPSRQRAALSYISPPQSKNNSPVQVGGSESEDEDPIPMRRRRLFLGGTPTKQRAAACSSPSLSLTSVRTVASIEPVEMPLQRRAPAADPKAAITGAFVAAEKKETERRFKELRRKIKELRKMVKATEITETTKKRKTPKMVETTEMTETIKKTRKPKKTKATEITETTKKRKTPKMAKTTRKPKKTKKTNSSFASGLDEDFLAGAYRSTAAVDFRGEDIGLYGR